MSLSLHRFFRFLWFYTKPRELLPSHFYRFILYTKPNLVTGSLGHFPTQKLLLLTLFSAVGAVGVSLDWTSILSVSNWWTVRFWTFWGFAAVLLIVWMFVPLILLIVVLVSVVICVINQGNYDSSSFTAWKSILSAFALKTFSMI